jgi:hypothetical protein
MRKVRRTEKVKMNTMSVLTLPIVITFFCVRLEQEMSKDKEQARQREMSKGTEQERKHW